MHRLHTTPGRKTRKIGPLEGPDHPRQSPGNVGSTAERERERERKMEGLIAQRGQGRDMQHETSNENIVGTRITVAVAVAVAVAVDVDEEKRYSDRAERTKQTQHGV